jgi:hypothetical protein
MADEGGDGPRKRVRFANGVEELLARKAQKVQAQEHGPKTLLPGGEQRGLGL